MKIHLVKKQTIINYALNNAQSRELLDTWLGDIKKAKVRCIYLFGGLERIRIIRNCALKVDNILFEIFKTILYAINVHSNKIRKAVL